MFVSAEIGHAISKQAYRAQLPALREALLETQYDLKQRGEFPLLILLHGIDGAGRGETMNLINEWLDPRLIQTVAFSEPNDEARARPWMWRYWHALPPKGRIGMFYGSYYSETLFDRVYRKLERDGFDRRIFDIQRLEHMLVNDGTIILKFWFHLSEAKQRQRLKALEQDPATRWRVTKADWRNHEHYQRIRRFAAHLLRLTNSAHAPWIVVDGQDAHYRSLTVGNAILSALRARLDAPHGGAPVSDAPPLTKPLDDRLLLDTLQLDQKMDKKRYRERLAELQSQLNLLTRHPKFAQHSLVLVFEGNDAAGKGGSIIRITQALDARQYRVVPVAAPSDEERAQPWLWRFWRQVPGKGGITIFDRSWYGRVLVERVEKLAPDPDWMRAYYEINDFEHQLVENGAVLLKFWLAISQEEQQARFQQREDTGFKRFKITAEDWRNRDKWDDYKQAVCDMIDRTSTHHVPWHLIEANNKYYARIKILELICLALKAKLG
jgi:polyphosphate:AMP phosphotransferase